MEKLYIIAFLELTAIFLISAMFQSGEKLALSVSRNLLVQTYVNQRGCFQKKNIASFYSKNSPFDESNSKKSNQDKCAVGQDLGCLAISINRNNKQLDELSKQLEIHKTKNLNVVNRDRNLMRTPWKKFEDNSYIKNNKSLRNNLLESINMIGAIIGRHVEVRKGEVFVPMGSMLHIENDKNSGEKRVISTSGLGGCIATVTYIKKTNGAQYSAITHYGPGTPSHLLKLKEAVSIGLKDGLESVDKIQIFIVVPGKHQQDEGGKWISKPSSDYLNHINKLTEVVNSFCGRQLEAKILTYSRVGMINGRRSLRDLEVVLENEKASLILDMPHVVTYEKVDMDKV